ncbi:MAG: DUF1893 domain-containing protein [Spirochaetales bacterium]|nr:DUF1893 domain-containing protein [Spirochaetales bacterium]
MYSLRATTGRDLVFQSNGKWLYPLFELEEHIKRHCITPGDIYLEDKIAGRAAASLMIRMGIKRVRIRLLSRYALDLFEKHDVNCSYDKLVDKIDCRTEDLITAGMSIDDTYRFLRKRAGFIAGLSLKIDNITAGYDGRDVLSGLSLELEAGGQLIVTGENGSGKSTLLRAVLGLVPVRAGAVLIDGKPALTEVAGGKAAYLNQIDNSNRDPVSAEEVVRIGFASKRLRKDEADYKLELAMRRTGCFDLAARDFHELSGGEKQKVSLSRCLCQEPGIFLMDEPTSFLDSGANREFVSILGELLLVEMPTIIIVSHDRGLIGSIGWSVKHLSGGRLSDD